MNKVIIGVHGLGNKPPKILLEEWWRLSINEGLQNIGLPGTKFDFELVYWADSFHPEPLNPDEHDKSSNLYLSERYEPARKKTENQKRDFKEKAINFLKRQRDKILFNETMHATFPSFTDMIIKLFFKDLDIYFTQNCVEENKQDCLAKDVINEKLLNILKNYKNREVLVIAHSMGTIVTYDTLIKSEHEVSIDSLLTIGSPLGVPFILNKLKNPLSVSPEDNEKLRVPENIKNEWINIADPDDKVAQNADLSNLFSINRNGVLPSMIIVDNDFESEGIENPHKSFGYLRTPEVAKLIDEFLCKGKNKTLVWIVKKFNFIKHKFSK